LAYTGWKDIEAQKMKAFVFPGQGSQRKGMGKELFDKYKDYVQTADKILGYSIKELCLDDPQGNLNHTQYTQPALFCVNALMYMHELSKGNRIPEYVAGHSLGEYNALFAAKVIDFDTGLRLVKKRGELMGKVQNGGMAAVLGLDEKKIRDILKQSDFKKIEIANLNTPSQIVISGDHSEIETAKQLFEDKKKIRYFILNVSGAFHSKFMVEVKNEFRHCLDSFNFSTPQLHVISNVTARPYKHEDVKHLLARQITHPVKWEESVCYMWGKGVKEFIEIGPGNVLTKMVKNIKETAAPLNLDLPGKTNQPASSAARVSERPFHIRAESLGCREYKNDYNLKYAYAAGGMVYGIASREMVIKMGNAGMIGYFGSGALSLEEIEKAVIHIQSRLKNGQPYGMNLISGPKDEQLVDLYLKHGVPNIEAAAYMKISRALVKYRLKGLRQNPDGSAIISNRIMGKLSRPEAAEIFLSPPPKNFIKDLLDEGTVTKEQARLAEHIPMADDICVEADSGGHTDMGVAAVLMPAICQLRDRMMQKYQYAKKIRIGAAGGIGTPEAVVSALMLGADFILTGSINQCTVEAGTSDMVKDLLQQINVQDTTYAPAGDMFEIGSKVQVLKKGVFFPARANKLYDLYRHYNSLEEIDEKTKEQLEKRFFQHSFDDIYEECRRFYSKEEIERADKNPKQKMALVFKWYFNYANRLALEGSKENKVNYQVYCGPALGAFNQWVKGSSLEKWQDRHVDEIALKLLNESAGLMEDRLNALAAQSMVSSCTRIES